MMFLDEKRLRKTLGIMTYEGEEDQWGTFPQHHVIDTHPVYPGVHEAGRRSLGEAIGGSNWVPFLIGAGLIWVTMTPSGKTFISSLVGG